MRGTSRGVTNSTMRGEEGTAAEVTRVVTGLRRGEEAGDPGEVEALAEAVVVEVVTCMIRVQEDSEEEIEAFLRREEAEDMRCHRPRRG